MKNFLVPGFEFAGIPCGIKVQKTKKDLGLILSTVPKTTTAGVFTQNRFCAAPVRYCQRTIRRRYGQLIVINSGNANAATGRQGERDVLSTAKIAARHFGLKGEQVLVCSTGKIGVPLPMSRLAAGFKKIRQHTRPENLMDCAEAILTTDAATKTAFYKGRLSGKPFHIAVLAKGAGMISPKMATLLCFIVTDLNIDKPVLATLLKRSVEPTLNALVVDGDTSTNDTVLMMANGLAQNQHLAVGNAAFKKINSIMTTLLEKIAILIASDGEGASRCYITNITGAKSLQDARCAAQAIAKSPLVKCAIHGGDPNWGRIVCALGYSGARFQEKKTTVKIGGHTVFARGRPLNKNEKAAARYLKNNTRIDLSVDLGVGRFVARSIASDLTCDYVRFNSHYTS